MVIARVCFVAKPESALWRHDGHTPRGAARNIGNGFPNIKQVLPSRAVLANDGKEQFCVSGKDLSSFGATPSEGGGEMPELLPTESRPYELPTGAQC